MKHITYIACLCLLSACADTGKSGNKVLGKNDKAAIYQLIHDNITTKSDAIRILGDPDDIDYYENSQQEKWTYTHINKSSLLSNYIPVINIFNRGTSDKQKKVILIFDKDGILQKQLVSDSAGETKNGLFN